MEIISLRKAKNSKNEVVAPKEEEGAALAVLSTLSASNIPHYSLKYSPTACNTKQQSLLQPIG
jgi:hypothetical protein